MKSFLVSNVRYWSGIRVIQRSDLSSLVVHEMLKYYIITHQTEIHLNILVVVITYNENCYMKVFLVIFFYFINR